MKRSKGKIEVHAGLKEFYKYYKNKYDKPVDYNVFASVIKDLNESISNAIIYDSFEFTLPDRLGYISVIKKKHKLRTDEHGNIDTRYLPVDFKATKELWAKMYPGKTLEEIREIPDRKRVYQRNVHSQGYIYSWFYNKFTSNATNKSVYYFKPTRTNSRELAAFIKSDDFHDDYYMY